MRKWVYITVAKQLPAPGSNYFFHKDPQGYHQALQNKSCCNKTTGNQMH